MGNQTELKDFISYIATLKFEDIEDTAYFIRQYYDDYKKKETAYRDAPSSEAENAELISYMKYQVVIAWFGPTLLFFVEKCCTLANEITDTDSLIKNKMVFN